MSYTPKNDRESLALAVTDHRRHLVAPQHLYEQMPQMPSFVDERHAADFEWIKNLFWRRRNVFIGVAGGFLALVIILTLLAPKSYTTTTKLIVGNSGGGASSATAEDANTSLPVVNALVGAAGVRTPETYVELIQEVPVAQRVIDNLGLKTSASRLLAGVTAKPVTDTQIIELSVTWRDPKMSAAIANEFASVFVDRERELIGDQATSAIKFLSTKIPEVHADLQKQEAALADYERTHTGAFVNSATQGVIADVSALQTKIAQVQVDESQAKAALDDVQTQLAATSSMENAATEVAVNPLVAGLQAQLTQVETQLAAARKMYTEQHPMVVALRQQRTELQSQIAALPPTVVQGKTVAVSPTYEKLREEQATLEAQIASDQAQAKMLDAQDKRLMDTVHALPTEALALAELQRKEKLSEEVYTTLERRYNEAMIAKTASLSDVSVTQPALVELAEKKPSLRFNALIGLLLGLVLGITGVFLVEYFDNTFKDESDVVRQVPLPVLASVPRVTDKDVKALPWLRTMTADSFMQLLSALRYSSDEEIRTLAVTSALLGDGKSTIATNLAIAMAGMTKGGALLVDADLRRPTIHQRLGIDDSVRGFSDVLIGSLRLDEAVRPTKHKGLYVLPAGSPVPNSMRLFQTERFERVCDQMRDRFPFVIIDTPALMSVFDGTFVASKADGTILVVAAGHTDARSTNRAIDRLRSFSTSNLLGIVLNQVPPAARQYGYYHQPRQPITIKDSITPPTHDSITPLLSDADTPSENGAVSETEDAPTLFEHTAGEADDDAATQQSNGEAAAPARNGVAPPSDEVTPVS